MDFPVIIFLFLFMSSFLFVNTNSRGDCPATKCSAAGGTGGSISKSPLIIRYPFRIRNLQPQNSSSSQPPPPACGLSGFEISCKQNKSFIDFGYRDNYSLEIKSISYEEKIINLIDPRNCVHGVFLNLNLTGTRFRYYYVLKEYTYLNCSVQLLPMPSFIQVPCLSSISSGHYVYIIEPSLLSVLPDSCTPIKTVGIPFSYSPYISGDSFGLRLSWDHSTVIKGNWIDIIYYKVLGMGMFVLMVITVGFVKTTYIDEEIINENEELIKKQNSMAEGSDNNVWRQ